MIRICLDRMSGEVCYEVYLAGVQVGKYKSNVAANIALQRAMKEYRAGDSEVGAKCMELGMIYNITGD